MFLSRNDCPFPRPRRSRSSAGAACTATMSSQNASTYWSKPSESSTVTRSLPASPSVPIPLSSANGGAVRTRSVTSSAESSSPGVTTMPTSLPRSSRTAPPAIAGLGPTDSRTRVPPSVGPTTPAARDFHPSNGVPDRDRALRRGGGAPARRGLTERSEAHRRPAAEAAAPAAPPRSSARVLPSSANRSASRESPSRDVAVTTPARVAMPVPRTPLAARPRRGTGSRLRISPPLGGGVWIRRPAARIPLVQEARIEPLAALGEPLVVGVANLSRAGRRFPARGRAPHGRECRRARVARRRPSGGGSARPTRSRSRPPG